MLLDNPALLEIPTGNIPRPKASAKQQPNTKQSKR
jgi:hypothetical protein